MEDIDRFWSHVDTSGGPDACWPWKLSRNRCGYGQFYPAGKPKVYAHRWLLGHLRGSPLLSVPRGIEDGCHRCDNPPCCNPAHLYVGTRMRNMADAVERSRIWQLKLDRCPQGHPYDDKNTYLNPSGSRKCRACRSAADKLAKERRKAQCVCKFGHALLGDNVLLCKNGTRKCRICLAAQFERARLMR